MTATSVDQREDLREAERLASLRLQRVVGQHFGGRYPVPGSLESFVRSSFVRRGWDSPEVEARSRARRGPDYHRWVERGLREMERRTYRSLREVAERQSSELNPLAGATGMPAPQVRAGQAQDGPDFRGGDARGGIDAGRVQKPVVVVQGSDRSGAVRFYNGEPFITVQSPGDLRYNTAGFVYGTDGGAAGPVEAMDVDGRVVRTAQRGVPDPYQSRQARRAAEHFGLRRPLSPEQARQERKDAEQRRRRNAQLVAAAAGTILAHRGRNAARSIGI